MIYRNCSSDCLQHIWRYKFQKVLTGKQGKHPTNKNRREFTFSVNYRQFDNYLFFKATILTWLNKQIFRAYYLLNFRNQKFLTQYLFWWFSHTTFNSLVHFWSSNRDIFKIYTVKYVVSNLSYNFGKSYFILTR
jgi:hypothetical protein